MSTAGQPTHPPPFERFVALGDSTTEGLDDPYADGSSFRGWADRLAERLAGESAAFTYANLAVRGRKVPQIRFEQLGPALALRPDLASVIGGVNDILRPSVDLDAVAGDIDAMVSELRAAGATVLMLTYPDLTQTITLMADRIRARIGAYNERLREVSDRNGALLIDLDRNGVNHPSFWAIDRLHANDRGHTRIADLAAELLGLRGDAEPDSHGDLPELDVPSIHRRLGADAAWATRHLAPWVKRRILGQSSGDGLSAKRPELGPIDPN